MAKDRSLVRASDIGSWTFCRRAWWLSTVQHAQHENPAALSRGDEAHSAHGQSVSQANRLQRIGVWLLVAAMILGGVLVLIWLLTG